MSIEVESLEREKAAMQEDIEFKDALMRLEKNPDFKKIIIDGFLEKDCARYARESVAPDEHGINAESRKNSLAMAQAAGYLKQYLSIKVRLGFTAQQQSSLIDEELELARSES